VSAERVSAKMKKSERKKRKGIRAILSREFSMDSLALRSFPFWFKKTKTTERGVFFGFQVAVFGGDF